MSDVCYIEVRPLTPGLLEDWLAFFDHDAFADNPDWSGCYCQHFHADRTERAWALRTDEENRAATVEHINAGRLNGYLAYAGGRPVGWCQAAPRSSIPNVANDPELVGDPGGGEVPASEDERVGSIVCFVVAEACRRQGVAAALLDAACAGFRAAGLTVAEAYPLITARGDASNYHGPLALYRSAGFELWRELKGRLVVRRELTQPIE
jgi:ribosomal protein S18 acetylase RimI-like enzyme